MVDGKIFSVNKMVLDGNVLKLNENQSLVNIGRVEEYTPKGSYLIVNPSVTSADTTFLGGSINRSTVESITIKNTKTVPSNAIASWDVSEKKDGSVMAWYTDKDNNNLYELYIGGEGGVKANPNSSHLFRNFQNVTTIDATYLDTSEVENMAYMFMFCTNLKNIDISNFNTSQVTNMIGIFNQCYSLPSLDIRNFDTNNVTNMLHMFQNCRSLINLNLSNFNTLKVTSMSHMFNGCRSLATLNLSQATFSSVTSFSNMFLNNDKIKTVYVKDENSKSFIESRLTDASITGVTITIA